MFIFSGFAHRSVKAYTGWLAGWQPGGGFGRFLPLKAGATPHHQPGVEEASPKSYLPACGMGEGVLIGAPHFTRKTSGLPNIPTAEFVYLKDEVVNQELLVKWEFIGTWFCKSQVFFTDASTVSPREASLT